MRGLATGLLMLFRLCWLVNIVLGIMFWTGNLLALVPIHMLVGLLVAVLLLALSILAGIRGAPAITAVGVVVAIAMVVVGVGQTGWLVGDTHWIIRILHLLVAVIAAAIAEAGGGRIRRSTGGAATAAGASANP